MKGIPIDKVDPHASWAVNPPEDGGEYYCTCGHRESEHSDYDNHGGERLCNEDDGDCPCMGFATDYKNPVEPPERDPDEGRD